MQRVIISFFAVVLGVSVFAQAGELSVKDGVDILAQSDKKLLPEKCSYQINMVTTDSDGKTKVNLMNGWKNGQDKNVMLVQQPARLAGSVHLRKAGVIWTYYTTNKKVTQMGYQAVFMGSLLNYGDVMASELSIDYDVVGIKASENDILLTLKVKSGHEGYDKIVVTIDKKTILPKKREFFALSGMLLKTCDFKEITFVDGKLISMRQEFYEPVKNQKTNLEYGKIVVLDTIPDRYYNEGYISRLGS